MTAVRGKKKTLTLRQPSETADTIGGFTEVLTPVRRMTGAFTTLSGNERMSAGKETVYATHRFIVDFPAGNLAIDESFLFTDDQRGLKYQIKFINNVGGQNMRLEFDLLEVT